MANRSEIILYQSEDGEIQIEVNLDGETAWLNLDQMAKLFQRDKSVISRHIKNIYDEGELKAEATVAKNATVQIEGQRKVGREIEYYNLDMIISIGYRVKSHRGVQFRIWATKALREYMVKGFVMDDDRLSGKQANYFDELVERVRKIRVSEANFYDKVKAIFATSIDYQPGADDAKLFYKTVQNKFHFAITGFTAAEIIVNRINAFKPKMGLIHTKGDTPTRHEAEIAKNYLEELELKRLELLVEQFLSFAELQSVEKRPMYMTDWKRKLDDFIRLNDKQVLNNAGKVSNEHMKQIVSEEYETYARKLLEQDNGETRFTKNDMDKALRKASRPQKDDEDQQQ